MKIAITNRLILSDVPPQLQDILRQRLRFENPKWNENERMGRWNGDTPRFLIFYEDIGKSRIALPRGYVRQIILLCRQYSIPYQLDDRRRFLPEVDFTFTAQLKPYQQQAVDKMLSKEFGTLSSPPGSGKTVMALYMISHRRQPALVVVHTKELAFQWVDRIMTFLDIPEKEIGLIGAGKRNIGEKISVALVQSLYRRSDDISEHTGYLIVDECHRTPSRTFTEAVSAFDSRYMLGLTATPWRRDKLSNLIYWHLGDAHHRIQSHALIEDGYLLKPCVIIRTTDFKPYFDPVNEYTRMLSELTADDCRNRLIAEDIAKEAASCSGICLVLSDRKKHCETLQSILKYKFNTISELITGDLSISRRREIIDRLNRGEVRILIATGQLMGEGFDCKELSTLFITTPIKFSGRLIQYLGRILRPAPGKKQARVFDYVDVNVGPLKSAAAARQNIYIGNLI